MMALLAVTPMLPVGVRWVTQHTAIMVMAVLMASEVQMMSQLYRYLGIAMSTVLCDT